MPAATPSIPAAAKAELTPTGKLRAGINFQNQLLTTLGPNGEQGGVAVEFARELARRLDVPLEIISVQVGRRARRFGERRGVGDLRARRRAGARQGHRLRDAADRDRSDLPRARGIADPQRRRSRPPRRAHRFAREERLRPVSHPDHQERAARADRGHKAARGALRQRKARRAGGTEAGPAGNRAHAAGLAHTRWQFHRRAAYRGHAQEGAMRRPPTCATWSRM